jgi:hypothetical protein
MERVKDAFFDRCAIARVLMKAQRPFGAHVCFFSNRPFEVKHFQTIRHYSVDVAHGLALLFEV